MPTVRGHSYKLIVTILVLIGVGYGAYYSYTHSTGVLLARAREAMSVNDIEGARTYLDQILASQPNHVDALLLMSRIAIRAGDHYFAGQTLDQVLSQEPDNPDAQALMAEVCLSQCRFTKVIEILDRLPPERAESEKGKRALALAGLVVGGTNIADLESQARELAGAVLSGNPDSAEAHLANAILLAEKGEGQQAANEARIGKARLGSSFLTEWVLGKSLFVAGELTESLAALEVADERRRARRDLAPPPHWSMELYLHRGLAYIAQGLFEEAERMLSIARENDPSSVDPSLALLNLYLVRAAGSEGTESGREEANRYYQRAVDELERQPKLLASNAVFRYQQALIQIYLRDSRNSLRNLEALAGQDPPFLQALHELGYQYYVQSSFTRAARTYQRILSRDPQNLSASYNLGTILIRNRDFSEARNLLQAVVTARPDWLDARLNFGLCSRLMGDFDKAEESYAYILGQSPNDADALIGLGMVASAKGDPAGAEKLFTQARDQHPDRSEPYYYLGLVAQEQGRTADAQAMFEKCLSINPENEFASMELVEINLRRGTWEPARERLEAILSNPNARLGTVAENALCLVDTMTGKFEDARRRLQRLKDLASEVNPDLRGAIDNNHALLASAQKNHAEALEAARVTVSSLPKSADAYYNLGTIQQAAGNYPEAVVAYRRSLEFDPDHSAAGYNLAVAEATLGQWDAALRTLTTLGSRSDASSEVLANLAEASLGAGQAEEALKVLDGAIARFPASADLKTLKVKSLLALARNEEADALASEVVKQFPEDGAAHMVRGVAAFQSGNYPECELRLRRAAQILPNDPMIQLNLATFLIDKGAFNTLDEAATLLDQVDRSGVFHGQVLNQRALLAFRRADYETTKQLLKRSLEQNSEQAEIQDLLRRIEEM
ncbi:MAG: tetratricopeptide repeat protein [Candidatus Omnitrophica bacterium]|nr:Beta-barrel assembly-enhancing protease [bacterium]NUN96089.1 tetratricopeptide repeat protein [Candidatus Omnitrophota bacterium]